MNIVVWEVFVYHYKDTFLCSLTQTQFTALRVDKETFKVVTAEFIIVVVCHTVLQIMYDPTQSVQRETAAALDYIQNDNCEIVE